MYHAFKLAEDYKFQTRHKLQELDEYEKKFTAWFITENATRFTELYTNDIDQSYFDKIIIHEARGKTLSDMPVAAVKKVSASLVTGTSPNETVNMVEVRKAIKTTYKAPAVLINQVFYQQHLITLNKSAGTGAKATTSAAAIDAGYQKIDTANSAAGKEVAYWIGKNMRKSQLDQMLNMYDIFHTSIKADVGKTAGGETDTAAKLTTFTPAVTKKDFIDAVAEATKMYDLSGSDDAAKFTNIFAKIRA